MAAAYTEILIPSEIKYSLRDTGSHDALQHVTNFAADHRVVQTRARTAIAPTGTLEAKGKRKRGGAYRGAGSAPDPSTRGHCLPEQ